MIFINSQIYFKDKLYSLIAQYKGLKKEVYIIFVSRIINALGCFVGPLMTLILTNKIGLSSEKAGFYIGLSGLIYIFPSILGGKLADTLGRKSVLLFFDALGAVFYIICGFINPSKVMIYLMIAAGACLAAAGPAHDSLIADLTTPKDRNKAFALNYMGWNIGFAVGPIIGGFLYQNHLRIVFIGDAFTTLISLLLILIFVKDTLHIAAEEITDEKRILERHEKGSIISVLMKRKILIYFALIIFGYNFSYSEWSFMMPMHASQNFGSGLGAKYYGFMASFNGLTVIFLTPIITKITEKIKNIKKTFIGGLFYAVGFGMLGILNSLIFFFVSVFIFTIGEIVLSTSVSPFIADHTPASHRGRMSAILPIIFGSGDMLGPMIMGNLLMTMSIEKGWLIVGFICLVSSLFMLLLQKYDEKCTIQIDN